MAIGPKVKQQILVKPHLRKGRQVRGYTREGEKRVDTELTPVGKQKQNHKELHEKFFDGERLKDSITDSDLESAVMDLFGSGHGVDRETLSREGIFQEIFDGWDREFFGVETLRFDKRQFFSEILKKGNVDRNIQFVDGLEAEFRKALGVKTTREDPFTFSFDYDGADTQLHALRENEKLVERIQNFLSTVTELGLTHGQASFVSSDGLFDQLISAFRDDPNKFSKGVAQTIISSNIANWNEGISPDVFLSFDRQKFDKFYREDLGGIYVGDGEAMRKELMKEFSRLESDLPDASKDEIRQLRSHMKKVDAASVGTHLTLLLNSGTKISKFEELNKELKSLAGYFGQRFNEKSGAGTSNKIYVSKNPLNILTMSPDKHVPSCQSLLQKDIETGNMEVNITIDNINVVGSALSHKTNDFVMYTTNKDGEKDARVSLTQHPETMGFGNYENMNIYGDNAYHKGLIGSFISQHPDKFEGTVPDVDMVNVQQTLPVKKFSDIYRKITDIAEKFPKLSDDKKTKVKEALSKFAKDWEDQRNHVYTDNLGEQEKIIDRSLERERTLLYNTKPHWMVNFSHRSSQTVRKMVLEVDRVLRELQIA